MKHLLYLLLCAPALLLAVPAQAQVRLSASTFGSGGGALSGPNNSVLATVGQTFTGSSEGLASGFWAAGGSIVLATAVEDEPGADELPRVYRLHQNYPNPFNPTTTIQYDLPEAAAVRLALYDVLGRRIHVLVDREQPAGTYRFQWDGRDAGGHGVASGLYLYRLTTPTFTQTRTLMLIK